MTGVLFCQGRGDEVVSLVRVARVVIVNNDVAVWEHAAGFAVEGSIGVISGNTMIDARPPPSASCRRRPASRFSCCVLHRRGWRACARHDDRARPASQSSGGLVLDIKSGGGVRSRACRTILQLSGGVGPSHRRWLNFGSLRLELQRMTHWPSRGTVYPCASVCIRGFIFLCASGPHRCSQEAKE